MRKSLIVLAATVSLLGLGPFAAAAVPALADDDDDLCITGSSVLPSGPIDLEAIPAQHVTGPLTIRATGIGCDDEDDDHGGLRGRHDDEDDED